MVTVFVFFYEIFSEKGYRKKGRILGGIYQGKGLGIPGIIFNFTF